MKSAGIGMDHNGQNQAPEGLSTTEFPVMITFQDKGWVFGNTSQQPWRIGMAPDGHIRPVLSFQKYLVTFLSDTGGSIEPDSLLYQWVTIGNNALSVQAEPLPKYTFYAWFSKNGDSLTSANPLVVTDIHRDTTIIAKYIYYDDIQEIPDYNLKIYPNPACEFITIVCENNFLQEERCFTITDLQGRVHYRKITTDEIISIDINHFIPGTYILSIIRGKAVFNKKIVIN